MLKNTKKKTKKNGFIRKQHVVDFYYNINGHLHTSCNEILDLGVVIHTSLGFVLHITKITNSALKSLDLIFRNA